MQSNDNAPEQPESHSPVLAPDNNLRGYILTAMFAGTAAAGGYMLMFIPNIEVITAVLFLAGLKLGVKRGIMASFTASLIYFGLNPQGTFPPLLAAQIIGISAAPVCGFLYRPFKLKSYRLIILGLFAFAITIWYDLITTLAFPISAGFDYRAILITLSLGIIPSIIHIGGNVAIFVILMPTLQNRLERFQPDI